MRNFLKAVIAKFIISLARLRNFYLIICPWGLGDTLFVGMCTGEIKKRKQKNIVIVCKKYTGAVCRDFETVDIVWAHNKLCNCFIYYAEACGHKMNENYIYAHILDENISGFDNIVDRYSRGIFKLNGKIEYVYPKVHFPNRTTIDMGNSIILAPYAKSKTCTVEGRFWEDIAIACTRNGYEVYTNCGSKAEKEIRGTKRLQVSIDGIYYLAERAKAFISYRSGICDWLALSEANMLVINDPMWGKEWNLNNFSRKEVKYFQYSRSAQEVILREIINEIDAM